MSADATEVTAGGTVAVHAQLTNTGDQTQNTQGYGSLVIACGDSQTTEAIQAEFIGAATLAPGETQSFSLPLQTTALLTEPVGLLVRHRVPRESGRGGAQRRHHDRHGANRRARRRLDDDQHRARPGVADYFALSSGDDFFPKDDAVAYAASPHAPTAGRRREHRLMARRAKRCAPAAAPADRGVRVRAQRRGRGGGRDQHDHLEKHR